MLIRLLRERLRPYTRPLLLVVVLQLVERKSGVLS